MRKIFALVDCDNFFASCEKVFRPDLDNRPLVVLSNNDGCIIARSKEAKALGIKMGAPVFQVRDFLRRHHVAVFSSNFALYGDMSNRVMKILMRFSPDVQEYSIDEAFAVLPGQADTAAPTARRIRQAILAETGLSTGIGTAYTRTLAKLASHNAKHNPVFRGTCDATDSGTIEKILHDTSVEDVWGVGRRLLKTLNNAGIYTAEDLAKSDPSRIRRLTSVVTERTIMELNGIPCILEENEPEARQQIMHSRTMAKTTSDFNVIREAVSSHAAMAAERLRKDGSLSSSITVFISTPGFRDESEMYRNSGSCVLAEPTDDTRIITKAASEILKGIYLEGFPIQKTGVLLSGISERASHTPELFGLSFSERSDLLMKTIDAINGCMPGSAALLSEGTSQVWESGRNALSPAYTTKWTDLPEAR